MESRWTHDLVHRYSQRQTHHCQTACLKKFSLSLKAFFAGVPILLIVAACFSTWPSNAQVRIRTTISHYVPPRPPFAGLHVGMTEDSANLILRRIAARRDTVTADSLTLIESDSVRI